MIRLGFNNRVDSAVLSSTASFEAALPLAHLYSPIIPKVARTTDAAEFVVSAVFSSPVSVGCIAIAGHNLDVAGKFRIVSKSDSSVVDDSGLLWAWPKLGSGIAPISVITAMSPTFVYFFPDNALVDEIEITISNSSNSAGYIQIGRLFAGTRFVPGYGEDYGGLSFGLTDGSEVQLSISGVRYVFNRPKLRSTEFEFGHLVSTEVYEQLLSAQRMAGLSGEVVFANGDPVLSVVSGTNAQDMRYFEQAFMGNFSQLDPLKNPYFNGFSMAFKLLEVAF